MNNHYVSQLIIKRFSSSHKINTFDMQTRKMIEGRQSHKIFCEKNIYDQSVETQMGQKVEQPFASLLDKKIMNQASVVLTREELFLLKKYLLLDSVKAIEPEFWANLIKSFSNNTQRYLDFSNDSEIKNLPQIATLKLSPHEILMRTMKLYLDCDCIGQMVKHPNATQELCCWAKVVYDSYLAFWDSADEQEFILSSTGMVSEYEPSHTIFQGLDLSKLSYLLAKCKNGNAYLYYMSFIQLMYENFNIFNLSSTRCMVLVNPFFRLYHGNSNANVVHLPIPDIWPTCFETREIVQPPKVKYMSPLKCSNNDQFMYTPVKLSVWDTLYLNMIILQQTHKLMGFSHIEKIIDSLAFANICNALNDDNLYELKGLDAFEHFIDCVLKDKYNAIFQYYGDLKLKCTINVLDMIDDYGYKNWRDIIENQYVLSYLLSRQEMVRTMPNFSFMGSPEERIKELKACLKKIQNHT